jgi:hypothetical protein
MAIITNYSTLKTAVADYLARDDLTSFVPNFIQNAENKLYRILNLRNEETALSVSISGGVAAVPSDFKALKFAYYDASPAYLLRWSSVNELYNDYPDRSETGYPYVISREGTNFIFGPVSIAGTLKGIYWKKLSSLSDSNTTNWYTSNAPDVLLYGALLESAPFIHNDARIPVWREFYLEAVDTLRRENENAEVSYGSLAQRVS